MINHFSDKDIEIMKYRLKPYQKRNKLIKKTTNGKDNKKS